MLLSQGTKPTSFRCLGSYAQTLGFYILEEKKKKSVEVTTRTVTRAIGHEPSVVRALMVGQYLE